MKTTNYCAVMMSLLLAVMVKGADSHHKPRSLKQFSTADATISKDLKITEDKAWQASSEKGRVIRLFEVPEPGVEN